MLNNEIGIANTRLPLERPQSEEIGLRCTAFKYGFVYYRMSSTRTPDYGLWTS